MIIIRLYWNVDKARKKTEFSFFELSIESHLYTPFKGMGGGGVVL